MFCIYCQKNEADAREHYLPQSLGRFQNFEPLLGRLCQQCNETIGIEIESDFARQSPEAVLRSTHWIRGRSRRGRNKRAATNLYQPEKIGGSCLYMLALDPQTGHDILWQTDKPGSIKEVSQFVLLDSDGAPIQHIPVPAKVSTGRDLTELFEFYGYNVGSPLPRMQVIAASGDEERIERALSAWNISCPFERRKSGPIPGPQIFMGKVGSAYYRALAKIGFHYALKYIPTITGNEAAFRPLRDFIRHGVGETAQFLASCNTAATSNGPAGHVLTVIAPPNEDIVVNMQFFAACKTALPQWRLVLGRNPTVLFVAQGSAHFFKYLPEPDGSLKGGEIVCLTISNA